MNAECCPLVVNYLANLPAKSLSLMYLFERKSGQVVDWRRNLIIIFVLPYLEHATVPIAMRRTDPIKICMGGCGVCVCVSSNENSFPPTEERKLLERGVCRWLSAASRQKIKRVTHVSFFIEL